MHTMRCVAQFWEALLPQGEGQGEGQGQSQGEGEGFFFYNLIFFITQMRKSG